jgi:hypothetical protein
MSDYSKIIMDSNVEADLSNRVTEERETRRKFLTVSRWAGREKDMMLLFAKFDKLQRETSDPEKKRDIAKIGAIEVYKLLGDCFASLKQSNALEIPGLDSHRGELWVDGELVYKDK